MTWQRYKLYLRNSLLLEKYFRVMEQFDSTLFSVIVSTLGLRCRSFHFMARFLAMAENTVFFEKKPLPILLIEGREGKLCYSTFASS